MNIEIFQRIQQQKRQYKWTSRTCPNVTLVKFRPHNWTAWDKKEKILICLIRIGKLCRELKKIIRFWSLCKLGLIKGWTFFVVSEQVDEKKQEQILIIENLIELKKKTLT